MSNVSVSQSWVDDMSRERQEMLRKLERQMDEIASLRAALKPFAEFAEAYMPNAEQMEYPEHWVLAITRDRDENKVSIRLGHLRSALKALEGT